MGEQTKYSSMTPAQIAATLTTPMIAALATAFGIDRLVPVSARTGTMVALIDRGLVTAGHVNEWTDLAREVAPHVLHANQIPAYAAPKPDPDSLAALIGKRLDINYGVSAGRSGVVKSVDERRGTVTIDIDGHAVTCDKLNVSISPDPEPAPMAAALRAERRKLDGYYDADNVPRLLDVVQLAHGAIGVVERVALGGTALVRSNTHSDAPLSAYDVNALRAVPPVAFEQAGVPGAIGEGNVPRHFATSELSQQAIMHAKRLAPGQRLTLAAIKTDDRYEYGRAYVYAVASIIDATRLIAARCSNESWHESAPARRLQSCPECWGQASASPAVHELLARAEEAAEERPAFGQLGQQAGPSVTSSVMRGVEQALDTIRDATSALALAATTPDPADPATDDDVQQLVDRLVRRASYLALRQVLDVLDGWREGARSNHDALSHRGERDCWEHFETDDVRRMIADAARDLGTADPTTGHERRVVEP